MFLFCGKMIATKTSGRNVKLCLEWSSWWRHMGAGGHSTVARQTKPQACGPAQSLWQGILLYSRLNEFVHDVLISLDWSNDIYCLLTHELPLFSNNNTCCHIWNKLLTFSDQRMHISCIYLFHRTQIFFY